MNSQQVLPQYSDRVHFSDIPSILKYDASCRVSTSSLFPYVDYVVKTPTRFIRGVYHIKGKFYKSYTKNKKQNPGL
jgi:hypothetical protein